MDTTLLLIAYTSGLVAAINPCGFAMLPAYLAFFLGTDRSDGSAAASVQRALVTSAVLAAGFLSVFLVVGGLLGAGVDGIRDVLPWVSIALGVGLLALGVWLLTGREFSLATPRLNAGGRTREARSMGVFGVSYAITSLGCTFPLFLGAVVTRPDGVTEALAAATAFTLGMATTVTALTVSIALAGSGLTGWLRRQQANVNRATGVILVLTGLYTIWFWWDDLTRDVNDDQPTLIRWVEELSFIVQRWVDRTGAGRVAVLLAMVVVAIALVVLVVAEVKDRRARAARRRTPRRPTPVG